MAKGRPLDVAQELLEAFRRSGAVNAYLVGAIPVALWHTPHPRMPPSSPSINSPRLFLTLRPNLTMSGIGSCVSGAQSGTSLTPSSPRARRNSDGLMATLLPGIRSNTLSSAGSRTGCGFGTVGTGRQTSRPAPAPATVRRDPSRARRATTGGMVPDLIYFEGGGNSHERTAAVKRESSRVRKGASVSAAVCGPLSQEHPGM